MFHRQPRSRGQPNASNAEAMKAAALTKAENAAANDPPAADGDFGTSGAGSS